jgi:flagellar motor switch/type III secretory pathway protein FliN
LSFLQSSRSISGHLSALSLNIMATQTQAARPEMKTDGTAHGEAALTAVHAGHHAQNQPGDPGHHSAGLVGLAGLTASGSNSALAGLPLQLDVTVPIPNFRVRDLLSLEKGAVHATEWPYGDDVPVWCGGAQLVWTEFEVLDDVMAVRVTRVL